VSGLLNLLGGINKLKWLMLHEKFCLVLKKVLFTTLTKITRVPRNTGEGQPDAEATEHITISAG